MMQAHRTKRTTTHRAEQSFLLRSTLICAVLLLGSAAAMWIAANWQQWSYLKRVALVALSFSVFWLFAVRNGQRRPKDWAKPLSVSSVLLGLAALMVGALLTLLNQAYHSGADSWRLFAWWALLLLPWAFGLQSITIILLTWLLTNVSISLLIVTSFFVSAHFIISLSLAVWNALCFAFFTLVVKRPAHITRVMRPLSFSVFAFSWAFFIVEYSLQQYGSQFFTLPWVIGSAALFFLSSIFHKQKSYFLSWLGYSATGMALVMHLTLTVLPQTGFGFYALLLVPLAALFLFAQMRRAAIYRARKKITKEQNTCQGDSANKEKTKNEITYMKQGLVNNDTRNVNQILKKAQKEQRTKESAALKQNWPLRSLSVFVMGVAAVFWASFLSVWGGLPLPVFAWFLFTLSMVLGVTQPWKSQRWWSDLWVMTWAAALLSMTVVWTRGELSNLSFIAILLVAFLWYLWCQATIVRFITAVWAIVVLWGWPWLQPHSALWQIENVLLDLRLAFLLIWVFLLTGLYYWLNQQRQKLLQPILLASWLWLVLISFAVWWAVSGWAGPDFTLPIFSSVTAFVFAVGLWAIYHTVHGFYGRLLVMIAAMFLAFVWWPVPWLTLSFLGFFYASYRRVYLASLIFFALFLIVLARWYGAGYLPLMEKIGRLLISAGLLGTLALALDYYFKAQGGLSLFSLKKKTYVENKQKKVGIPSEAPSSSTFTLSRGRGWVALIFGVVLIFGSSAWYVHSQQHILRHGISFELSLLPTDPSVVVQSDSMDLHFALNQSIRLAQIQHPEMSWPHLQLKVWVRPSKKQGARLHALTLQGQTYLVQWVTKPLFAYLTRQMQYAPNVPPNQRLRQHQAHPMINLVPILNEQVLHQSIPILMKKKLGQWTPDGVNAWYFEQGQGLAYSQAKWGRFKANGRGAVVLEKLLNERQQPIP